jgi:hypothetical protein
MNQILKATDTKDDTELFYLERHGYNYAIR